MISTIIYIYIAAFRNNNIFLANSNRLKVNYKIKYYDFEEVTHLHTLIFVYIVSKHVHSKFKSLVI